MTKWHRGSCPEIWGYGCDCGGIDPPDDAKMTSCPDDAAPSAAPEVFTSTRTPDHGSPSSPSASSTGSGYDGRFVPIPSETPCRHERVFCGDDDPMPVLVSLVAIEREARQPVAEVSATPAPSVPHWCPCGIECFGKVYGPE